MGARHFWTGAALCALTSFFGPVAAQAPKPGVLETYKDWTVGCDNRNHCEAVALQPETGEWPETPATVVISRDAGPDAGTEVSISRDAKGRSELGFFIDGHKVAGVTATNGEAVLRGPQASALAIAMAHGAVMEIRSGAKVLARPSLSGSAAALRYIDARQGRAGTSTALIATGPLGPVAVRAAPATPAIRRAPLPEGPAPSALWRDELTALGKFTGCAEEMRDASEPPELHRLSKTETLILVPCGSGAYNATSIPVIATGPIGRRAFRYAAFDYQPGWGEDKARPDLVNAGWTPATLRLDSFAKGRGIGDCGTSAAYVWDGTRFRLIEQAAMGECRGAWHWITTWTAVAVE